jgi:ABC-2 type transport system permease protein
MSTMSFAVTDSATMLRRNLRHMQHNPSTLMYIIGIPVVFLLLFVYVFGNALGTAVVHVPGGNLGYVNYLVPGLIVMTAATGSLGTATSVCMDMLEGIISRFKTMAIFRPSILIARVISSMFQTLVSMAAVIAVAVLTGFRPTATPVEWLAATGLLAMVTFSLTWLAVAFGLAAKSVEVASNLPFPFVLLPFVGSGVVPVALMANGVKQFAEYQPFTPIIETLRGLLMGTPIGNNAIISAAWCAGFAVIGYTWSIRKFSHPE